VWRLFERVSGVPADRRPCVRLCVSGTYWRCDHAAVVRLARTSQLPYASSLCGACREVCPVKIDIPRLLLHLRSEITQSHERGSDAKGIRSKAERIAFRLWTTVMTRPWLYGMSASVARAMQRLIVRQGRIGKLSKSAARFVPQLGAWTASETCGRWIPLVSASIGEAS